SQAGPSGEQELVVSALIGPNEDTREEEKRSVTGAYLSYLYKVGGKIFRYTPKTTRLARVDWGPISAGNSDDNVTSSRDHVRKAEKIVLSVALAVTLASMQKLPEGRSPACNVRVVPCDHVSYFENQESIRRLGELLLS